MAETPAAQTKPAPTGATPTAPAPVASQRTPAPVAFQRAPGPEPTDPQTPAASAREAAAPGVAFEHICCQAVRPNPFDPEIDAQDEAPPKEPYLVRASAIRPAAGFALVIFFMGIAGLGAVMAGFAGVTWGIWTGGGVAGILFAYAIVSYASMRSAAGAIEVEATRHVMEPVVERGKLFHVALDTQASRIPGGLVVEITDMHSPGLRPVERPRLAGLGRLDYMVRAQGRGLLTFKGLELWVRSRDRLWSQEREYRYRTTIEASASVPAVAFRARLTGAALMPQNMPQHIIKLYKDVESEITRAFGPGDRLRDVDWKRAAISGQLITRQRSQEGEQTVLLTMDTSRSMLQDQAGFRNLDLAVEFAQEFMEVGLRRNHEVGMLAFNEEEIVDHVRPARKKIQGRRLTLHLRSLAGHHLPEDGEEPLETHVIGNPENLLVGLQQGIRQRQTQLLTIIVFTDLRTIPEEIAQGLARAATNGQRVVVMLLPPPKFKPVVPGREDDEEDEDERRGAEHMLRLRELMMGQGVQFLEINPRDEDLKLDLRPSLENLRPGAA